MNNNLMSLWKVLNNYEKIVIPLYQRDYAQGRDENEELRRKFVTRLFDALRDSDGRKVKLDYVFGVVNNSEFHPLDGQQRLTTLWLLHWYLSQKAQTNGAEVVNRLKRFSYETRATSTEFCEHLAMTRGMSGSVVEFIKNQTWYLSVYEKDPTVRGMLNTLDTIEKSSLTDDDSCRFWKSLTDEADCPISFFVKVQGGVDGAEDLYLKMNSRGKKLTEFENFKADLIGCKGENGEPVFQVEEAKLIDNDWTDIFWGHKNDDGEIDEIYFQFFKRYLLAYWITEKCAEAKVEYIIHKDKDKPDNLFSHLHQGTGRYVSIEPYKPSVDSDMVTRLKSFFAAYAKCKGENNCSVAPYWNSTCTDYSLIPCYSDKDLDKVFDRKLYEGLPIFYAACRFLEKYCSKGESHSEEFKQWMRFAWNLVNGSLAGNPDVMVGLLRLIKKITDCDFLDVDTMLVSDWEEYQKSSTGVYAELFKDPNARTAARTRALHGEIQKARLRVFQRNEVGQGVYAWNDKISTAESIGFLEGALEFLLPESLVDNYILNPDSRNQIEDDFTAQINHLREYLGSNEGVKREFKIPLVKAMIKGMDHFWALPKDKRTEWGISDEVADGFYDNEFLCRTDKKAWHERIFRNPVTARALANALKVSDLGCVEKASFQDGGQAEEDLRQNLLDSGILDIDGVVGPGDQSSWRFRGYKDEMLSFYRASGSGCRTESPRYYLDSDPIYDFLGCRRNAILLTTDLFIVEEEDRVKDKIVCAPKDRWCVHFTFNNNKFIWGRDNTISLIGDDDKVRSSKKYDFSKHSSLETFKELLENIVAKSESKEPKTVRAE